MKNGEKFKSSKNNLYIKLLSNKQHTNLGYVYENVVAQMLKAKGDSLAFCTTQVSERSAVIDLRHRKQTECKDR